MKLSLAALMKTFTGKTIAGLVIATTSVGAAAAAGADVPVLTTVISSDDDGSDGGETVDDEGDAQESTGEPAGGEGELRLVASEPAPENDGELDEDGDDVTHGAVVSEFTQAAEDEYGLTGCAKGQATAAVARGDLDPESETIEEDLATFIDRCDESDDDESEEDGDDDTHGALVSEFTQSVEELYGLTGCEKGQATAAVARGDVDPESETIEDDLVTFIERCPNYEADEEPGEEEATEQAASSEEDDLDRKTVHEEGKTAFHEAQAEYDAQCGDDDAEADAEGDEDGDDEGDDEPMSELCRELKEAAKAAHAEWKDATREARESEKAERRSDEADHPGTSGQHGQGKANGKKKDR